MSSVKRVSPTNVMHFVQGVGNLFSSSKVRAVRRSECASSPKRGAASASWPKKKITPTDARQIAADLEAPAELSGSTKTALRKHWAKL